MGFNMQKLMKQAQKMQSEMAKAQESLAEMTVEGESGGGMVKVVVNGCQQIVSVKINPEIVDPEDVEMLEDLVLAAVKEGVRLSQEMANETMQKITGGMGLPNGLF